MARKPSHKRSQGVVDSFDQPFVPRFSVMRGRRFKWSEQQYKGKTVEALKKINTIVDPKTLERIDFEQLKDFHLKVVELPIDKDSVREFAREWGLLVTEKVESRPLTLDYWAELTAELRAACEISAALRKPGNKRLLECFELSPAKPNATNVALGYEVGAKADVLDPRTGKRLQQKFSRKVAARPDQVRRCGRELLNVMMDSWIRETVVPRVAWDRRDLAPRIEMNTSEVIGLAWVALLNSVQFGGLGHCEQCKKLMRKGGPSVRKDRRFCGSPCRSKWHRAANKKAEGKEKAKKRSKKTAS